jgi:CubicO group peptidase (beta-lactamase class C family)
MKITQSRRVYIWGGVVVLLLAGLGFLTYLLVSGLNGTEPIPALDYWPTHGWQTTSPEEQGIDSARLAEGLQAIQADGIPIHSLVLIRDGMVVVDVNFYPYDGRSPHNVASVTKSLITTLIGIAADQGFLDLDDRLVSFFPEYAIANRDKRKDKITLRHLASMSAGMECSGLPDELTVRDMEASLDWVKFALDLPMVKEPGTQWNYCGVGMHLLSAVLEKATGKSSLEFARLYLFEPLGIQDVFWPTDPQGYNLGAGNIRLYPLDMAKLGLLWLHEGEWDGQQIVSSAWVRASVKPYFKLNNDAYGYGWWISSNQGSKVYNAVGSGGQRIAIDPSLNTVLVTTGGGFEFDELLNYLLPAIIDPEQPLPVNQSGSASLKATVTALAQTPIPQPPPMLPEMATRISGQIYQFEKNLIMMETMRLDFNTYNEASLQIAFTDGRQIPVSPVGLDSVYRLTSGLDMDRAFHPFIDFQNLEVGLRGTWVDPETFVIEYDTIADRFAYLLRMHFQGNQVSVIASERGSGIQTTFEGWLQNP